LSAKTVSRASRLFLCKCCVALGIVRGGSYLPVCHWDQPLGTIDFGRIHFEKIAPTKTQDPKCVRIPFLLSARCYALNSLLHLG
jgi:hypothetical protein